MPPRPPRRFGAVNWLGLWTLYRRGIAGFLAWPVEGFGGPAVGSLLFLAVFALISGRADWRPGIGFLEFIAVGIAIYNFARCSFEWTAAAVVDDKLERVIVNPLLAPLTPLEMLAGYVLAGASCGLLAGLLPLGLMALLLDLPFAAPVVAAGFALAAALLFALVGMITGLWAEKWDNFSFVDTLFVLPLAMLSGAFFSLDRLGPGWAEAIRFNPLHHAVNGFRHGVLGAAEGAAGPAALVLAGLTVALGLIAWRLVAKGYKLKA